MATTPGAIRDRMVTLVKGITPALHAAQKFMPHREELAFRDYCEANPAQCLRRFSVRNGGSTTQALVTSTTLERVEDDMIVEVAYPADWRHGGTQLLGLDDVIASDAVKIETAIGVPSADSTLKGLATVFRPGETERDPSGAVVFLTIRYRVEYARSLA